MGDSEKRTGGYGDGFAEGWRSVAGSGPVPPYIGIVPIYVVPENMTVFEYGYAKGRGEAIKAKAGAS
jgi:hypothetical protein